VWVLCGLVTAAQEQPSPAEPAKALPAKVVQAWEKTGAKVGWMGLNRFGNLQFAAGCDLAQLADPEPRLMFGDRQGIDPNPSAVPWMEAHFSPDSKLIVAGGSKEDSLALWDAKTGRRLRKLLYNNEPLRLIRRVTFSPDGKYVFAATDLSPVVMWDTQTGKQL
jgi:hypothetical protein